MPGEAEHAKGADGAFDAKRWLEKTTRVQVHWVNPDKMAVKKLTFDAANGSTFSFDIGGVLRGGELDRAEFYAEVKKYKDAADQGTLYRDFLAKCYRAYTLMPSRCDNFMWITWAPFRANDWSKLDEPTEISEAVLSRWKYNFGAEAEAEEGQINQATLQEVVLSDHQVKHLSMSDDHLAVLNEHETRKGGHP
jgi:hypothetical protein